MANLSCCDTSHSQFRKIENLAGFLKTISDVNRVKILCILSTDIICVCDLANALGLSQNLVSHHLKILLDMKILKKRRSGNKLYYSITEKYINKIKLLKKLLDLN